MKPAAFQYHRATSVDDAVDALADHDDPTILAGGQSLIPTMNTRLAAPETVVDISFVDELDYVDHEDGEVAIGALVKQRDAEESDLVAEQIPLVQETLSYIGHESIRNKGTVGGNLAHGDPSSELPATALARDATFVIHGPDGERSVDAAEFFLGYMTTAVGPEELLSEVRFPALPDGRGYSFQEVAPREGDYALAGVAATLEVEGDTCTEARLAYNAVGNTARRVPEAEAAVEGEAPTAETFQTAGAVAREQLDPPSDVHGSTEYRENLVETLTEDALLEATDRAEA